MNGFNDYILNNYNRYPVSFCRASGMSLWTEEGEEYLDFFPGWAVSNIGHCHPKVVEAIVKQAQTLIHLPNVYYNAVQLKLARRIVENSFGSGKVFFCNSGAEASEAALKLARLNHPDKHEIITFRGSFHGRTMGSMMLTAQEGYQQGLEPLPGGFVYATFNDEEDLKKKFNSKTAAVMLEPVQGEGGIHVASPSFLQAIRQLCDEYGALLIFDEVQTGMGRTGKMFGYQTLGVTPDAFTLAKALGGGMPIGALVMQDKLKDVIPPGKHASTFGGNAVACAAASAVFEVMLAPEFFKNVAQLSSYLRDKLEDLARRHACIKEVRGVGMMLGVELDREATPLLALCREQKVLINVTQKNVLRMMPALTVTTAQIDRAISVLDGALAQI